MPDEMDGLAADPASVDGRIAWALGMTVWPDGTGFKPAAMSHRRASDAAAIMRDALKGAAAEIARLRALTAPAGDEPMGLALARRIAAGDPVAEASPKARSIYQEMVDYVDRLRAERAALLPVARLGLWALDASSRTLAFDSWEVRHEARERGLLSQGAGQVTSDVFQFVDTPATREARRIIEEGS